MDGASTRPRSRISRCSSIALLRVLHAEGLFRPAEERLRGVLAPAKGRRDLAHAQLIDVPEDEGGALQGGQVAQRGEHRFALVDGQSRGTAVGLDLADHEAQVTALL